MISQLHIHNDGKEKFQSFEARLPDSLYNLDCGYGENISESVDELLINIDSQISGLEKIREAIKLNRLDPEFYLEVGWDGRPLKRASTLMLDNNNRTK